MICKDIQMYCS